MTHDYRLTMLYNITMLSDWSARRRFIIIAIVVGFIALVSVILYFILRPPRTCFDGKKNQNETGVDCGGVCSLQCKDQMKPLTVLWTKTFPVGNGLYDVAALVENQNKEAAVVNFNYNVQLFDNNGRAIVSKDFSTFANAGDHFLLFAGGLSSGGASTSNATLSIKDDYKFYKASMPTQKKISVTNYNLIAADAKPRLVATLQNETTDTFSNVPVTVMIQDKTGPVAVSETYVSELLPREKKEVTFTWPTPLKYIADTEACEKPADVMLVMDRSASMKNDGENPPEPLTTAKSAAVSFVEKLPKDATVGYVTFATDVEPEVDQKLTSEFKTVETSISNTEIHKNGEQLTNFGDALRSAFKELTSERKRPEAKQVVVFLTDGEPTFPKNPADIKDGDYPIKQSNEAVKQIKDDGIELYTIGLGSEVKADYLSKIASYPEYYYPASSGRELFSIYGQISKSICKKPPSVIEIIPRVYESGEVKTR